MASDWRLDWGPSLPHAPACQAGMGAFPLPEIQGASCHDLRRAPSGPLCKTDSEVMNNSAADQGDIARARSRRRYWPAGTKRALAAGRTLRTQNPDLAGRAYDEGPGPSFHRHEVKPALQKISDMRLISIFEAHQEYAMVGARSKSPQVRKIQVLGHEKATLCLRGFPHEGIACSAKPLLWDRMDIVTQGPEPRSCTPGNVFIQFDSHATVVGRGPGAGAGRSSTAEAAANAMHARTCASVSPWNSSRMVSMVSPLARKASTMRRGILVPLRIGCPAQMSGS